MGFGAEDSKAVGRVAGPHSGVSVKHSLRPKILLLVGVTVKWMAFECLTMLVTSSAQSWLSVFTCCPHMPLVHLEGGSAQAPCIETQYQSLLCPPRPPSAARCSREVVLGEVKR